MHQALKDAANICKTIMRNGYDAHIVNAPLQESLLRERISKALPPAVDIACEIDFDALLKLFPHAQRESDQRTLAVLSDNGVIFRFYTLDSGPGSHPELALLRVTPSMAEAMTPDARRKLHMPVYSGPIAGEDLYDGFEDLKNGIIRLNGLPDETLKHNYLLAIRALRFAANYDLPIDPNSWMAIVRASARVLDYVPAQDIMEEWRKVAAESMHSFVKLLFDSHILQGLIPEIASLACVVQQNDKGVIDGNVFEHTLKAMRLYPETGMHYDWLGAMAMLFHDVGKLYTAEYSNGRWTYFQHHKIGAKVTRKILRRLHFDLADADLICHLVNQHMRFHFMMTDQGIRRFKEQKETTRLIAMAKADLLARDDSFTSFNHNLKYLERAETPAQLLEPLLNGNEIMNLTCIQPGPMVGAIRAALLRAQQDGEVTNREEAIVFARNQAKKQIDETR